MNHIKTYELFGFGSKKPVSWKQKFDHIYNFYLKNKNEKDISVKDRIDASVNENEMSISKGIESLRFYRRNNTFEIIDFSEFDYKSDKGVYKITSEIYEEYKKKIQEISDWLDERSEKSLGKSRSNVSDADFNLDFDEADLALEEVSDKIKEELKLIGNDYEFEISYYLLDSNSSYKMVVERRKFKINDLKIDFGGDRFYCKLFTKDPFNKNAEIWLESDSSHEYYDLEENKWPYDRNSIINMNTIEEEMSRKEKRDFEKNRKYTYPFRYDITPSQWKSIELIKNITTILEEMNNMIKNKK